MKKTLAVLLALVMLLTMIPATFAEGNADFTLVIKGGKVDDHLKTVNGQELLAVDVTLNGTVEDKLCSLTFELTYNKNQITYVDAAVADGLVAGDINTKTEGTIGFAFVSVQGVQVTNNQPVVTLYFKVAGNLADGTEIAFALADGANVETYIEGSNKVNDHAVAADFKPFIVSTAVEFDGVVKFNEGAVQYKGATPYVIWNHAAGKHEPAFTVYKKDGKTVVSRANYDYEYKENKQPGTGYLFVYFKGEYKGEAMLSFKIYLPATTSTTVENVKDGIKITWTAVQDAAGYVIYRRAWSSTTNGWTAFARWDNTTKTTYLDGHDASHKVFAGTRYQYGVKAYFKRRMDPIAGAEIGGNVNEPSGNFNLGEVGPLKTTVRITTRKLTAVTAGSKKLTVKWEGSSVFTGYQLQYAENAAFTKNAKAIKINDPKTVETVLKSLKSGTTYYVRLRSYHEFNGMTYFGEWSNVMNAKVK
ncbi:MAG: fibronectin type III domain-containing protein [Clostridia bacterium]|nr:fibronectin type III domain-containing protein [Clostridia bacterium]